MSAKRKLTMRKLRQIFRFAGSRAHQGGIGVGPHVDGMADAPSR